MKKLVLSAVFAVTTLYSFAALGSTCKCEQAEYAELIHMTKSELFKVYCVAKVGYGFDQKAYKKSGDKQAFEDMKSCFEEMQRAAGAYNELYGVNPPSCEKLKKARIKKQH